MLDPRHAKPVIRHLEKVGGTDVVIVGHEVYEIRVRKLDEDTVHDAIRRVIEQDKPQQETPHDPE